MDSWIQKELLLIGRDVVAALHGVANEIKNLKLEVRNLVSNNKALNAETRKQWERACSDRWDRKCDKKSWSQKKDFSAAMKSRDVKVDTNEWSDKEVRGDAADSAVIDGDSST